MPIPKPNPCLIRNLCRPCFDDPNYKQYDPDSYNCIPQANNTCNCTKKPPTTPSLTTKPTTNYNANNRNQNTENETPNLNPKTNGNGNGNNSPGSSGQNQIADDKAVNKIFVAVPIILVVSFLVLWLLKREYNSRTRGTSNMGEEKTEVDEAEELKPNDSRDEETI